METNGKSQTFPISVIPTPRGQATWRECGCLVLSSDCSTKTFATRVQLLVIMGKVFNFICFISTENHEKSSVQYL